MVLSDMLGPQMDSCITIMPPKDRGEWLSLLVGIQAACLVVNFSWKEKCAEICVNIDVWAVANGLARWSEETWLRN